VLKRKANRILFSSDEEDEKKSTPPPKKKQVIASTSTVSCAQAPKPRLTQTSPQQKKSKRKKKESDYEETSTEDDKESSDPDFMDVDEVEEVKKAPTKVKASAKRANVADSSGATRGERKPKATPAKIEDEDHKGGKPTPKFKYATF
jgi:hypothetical protein